MSGPPPTPLHLRLLKGNPGKRPIRPEVELAQAPTCPDPPPFLRGYASDEYWRIVLLKGDPASFAYRLGSHAVVFLRHELCAVAHGGGGACAHGSDADPVTHALLAHFGAYGMVCCPLGGENCVPTCGRHGHLRWYFGYDAGSLACAYMPALERIWRRRASSAACRLRHPA